MAAIGGHPIATFVNEYNFWDRQHNPNRLAPLTPAVALAGYAASSALPYVPVAAGIPVPLGPTPGLPVLRPTGKLVVGPAPPLADLPFLAPIASLVAADLAGPNWTGVKVLGRGGNGTVAMWEYTGPAAGLPAVPKIAVKTATNPSPTLRLEGQKMTYCNEANSPHVVRLLVDPAHIITPAAALLEVLGPAWTPGGAGIVRRLIMEYCHQGSLQDLQAMRQGRRIRYEELTLWRIFECLVDACAVFEYGAEFGANAAGVPIQPANPFNNPVNLAMANPRIDPGQLVHFDMKPANVMLTPRIQLPPPGTHPDTPLCKIGDFGASSYRPRNPPNMVVTNNWATNQILRTRGTEGFFAPEQFSERWNHIDFGTSPVCGRYGPRTNVWGIGEIILACFNQKVAEVDQPWTPAALRQNAARGRVYGIELQNIPNLSAELKDTIQECLYEIPSHRPGLVILRRRIRDGIAACIQAGDRPEGWQNLDYTVPLTPAEALADPEVLVQCSCVTIISRQPPARRCGRFILRRATQTVPRCWDHWDLRELP